MIKENYAKHHNYISIPCLLNWSHFLNYSQSLPLVSSHAASGSSSVCTASPSIGGSVPNGGLLLGDNGRSCVVRDEEGGCFCRSNFLGFPSLIFDANSLSSTVLGRW